MNRKKFLLSVLSFILACCTFTGCTSGGGDLDSENATAKADTQAETTAKEAETQPEETKASDVCLPKEKEYSVLFIGNSFTYCNDLPEDLFASLCKAAGYNVKVDSVTRGGYYLHQFASSGDEYGRIIDQKFAAHQYDYIILQEQSGNAAVNPDGFFGGVRSLVRKIRKTQDHAQVVLYETWGYKEGYHLLPTHGGDTAGMEMKLRAAYTAIAKELDLKVALVGAAFLNVYQNNKDIELYDTDLSHPSRNGSALAACTIFTTIFGGDIREIEYNPRIGKKNIQILQEAAYSAVYDDNSVPKRQQISSEGRGGR